MWNLESPDPTLDCVELLSGGDPLEFANETASKMLRVVKDGKGDVFDHTEWGYLNEVQQLCQRIINVTTMALSKRPSGVGL